MGVRNSVMELQASPAISERVSRKSRTAAMSGWQSPETRAARMTRPRSMRLWKVSASPAVKPPWARMPAKMEARPSEILFLRNCQKPMVRIS